MTIARTTVAEAIAFVTVFHPGCSPVAVINFHKFLAVSASELLSSISPRICEGNLEET